MGEDSSERVLQKLHRWFWNGPSPPEGPDGTIGWMLGMTLHWRMMLFSAIMGTSLLGAILAGNYLGHGSLAGFVGWFIGIEAGMWMLKVSPKYDVSKNY